jgi:3-(3-hydroxy-phenyl)propionate hydroxylase
VLDLAERHEFARPLVNSGRLSVPCVYDGSPLNSADALDGPAVSRPGAPCPDAPVEGGHLLGHLGDQFILLTINTDGPDEIEEAGVQVKRVALTTRKDKRDDLAQRYLGQEESAVYLIRPDQHVAARRPVYNDALFRTAIRRALAVE